MIKKILFRSNTNQYDIAKWFEKTENIMKQHIQIDVKKIVLLQKYVFKAVKYKIGIIKLSKKSKWLDIIHIHNLIQISSTSY